MNYTMDVKLLNAPDDRSYGHLVVVVGAGGTGARVLPPLIKMLGNRDTVAVLDDDTVEQRNCLRQHFSLDDVGRYKAQVMEERYHNPQGVHVMAITQKFSAEIMRSLTNMVAEDHSPSRIMLLGCVDSIPARAQMLAWAENSHNEGWNRACYLDAGNETRTGQALVAHARGLRMDRAHSTILRMPGMGRVPIHESVTVFNIHGAEMFPELFEIEKDARPEGPTCVEMFDTQTVMVNQMAATCLLNLAMPFLYSGVSLRNLGVLFSTYNSMTPILPTSVRHTYRNTTLTLRAIKDQTESDEEAEAKEQAKAAKQQADQEARLLASLQQSAQTITHWDPPQFTYHTVTVPTVTITDTGRDA